MKYELYIHKIGLLTYEVSLVTKHLNIWVFTGHIKVWKIIELINQRELTTENCLVHIDKNSLLFRIFDLQNFETKHYKP